MDTDSNSTATVSNVIETVLNHNGPIFCDIHCANWNSYLPKVIGWNTPIEDMYPYLSDEEFYENMIIDPIPREKFGDDSVLSNSANP
jgi:acetolactate synthase-1/2/3 large subunit